MHFPLPKLRRVQLEAYAYNAIHGTPDRPRIMRETRKQLADQSLEIIADQCVESTTSFQGIEGQILKLDVYVLKPWELRELITQAVAFGREEERTSYFCKETPVELLQS